MQRFPAAPGIWSSLGSLLKWENPMPRKTKQVNQPEPTSYSCWHGGTGCQVVLGPCHRAVSPEAGPVAEGPSRLLGLGPSRASQLQLQSCLTPVPCLWDPNTPLLNTPAWASVPAWRAQPCSLQPTAPPRTWRCQQRASGVSMVLQRSQLASASGWSSFYVVPFWGIPARPCSFGVLNSQI